MQPPFHDHPMIRQFNELKKYFREHETAVTRERVKEFHRMVRFIEYAGMQVAFDFLGSVNFGQATSASDVDMVIYMFCDTTTDYECSLHNCYQINRMEQLLLRHLPADPEKHPYRIHIVDCINLNLLEREIINSKKDSSVLFRFAFYRSVCRLVNARLIRPYQKLLEDNRELMAEMEPEIRLVIENLVNSSKHNWSFEKYKSRIREAGVRIPGPILQRIQDHLEQRQSPQS